jgi:hypothetical protein
LDIKYVLEKNAGSCKERKKKKRSQNRYAKIGYFVNKQLTLVVERCLFTITTTTKCFALFIERYQVPKL